MEVDSEEGTKCCYSSSPGCPTEVETTEAAVTTRRTAQWDYSMEMEDMPQLQPSLLKGQSRFTRLSHILLVKLFGLVCAQMVLCSRPKMAGHLKFNLSLPDRQDFWQYLTRFVQWEIGWAVTGNK